MLFLKNQNTTYKTTISVTRYFIIIQTKTQQFPKNLLNFGDFWKFILGPYNVLRATQILTTNQDYNLLEDGLKIRILIATSILFWSHNALLIDSPVTMGSAANLLGRHHHCLVTARLTLPLLVEGPITVPSRQSCLDSQIGQNFMLCFCIFPQAGSTGCHFSYYGKSRNGKK